VGDFCNNNYGTAIEQSVQVTKHGRIQTSSATSLYTSLGDSNGHKLTDSAPAWSRPNAA
jgi:hypothetical protein